MAELIDFNFEHDQDKMSNSYPASDVQYIYINDLNSGNYQNNFINFSNMTVIGNSAEKYFDWSQAYVNIPYTVFLDATDCYFGKASVIGTNNASPALAVQPTIASIPENAYAVGVKGYHHFIDTTYIKYNGVNVNRNTSYVNFMINENLKKMADEEYRLVGDLLCHSYDGDNSLLMNPVNNVNGVGTSQYDATKSNGLEINNNANFDEYCYGFSSNYNLNMGHINRMNMTNLDLDSSNSILNKLLTSSTISDCFQNCYLGPSNNNQRLSWTGVATVPLAKICDFFGKIPTVASAQGFEFKLQTNIGGPNSYTYNFTFGTNGNGGQLSISSAVANNALTAQSVSAVQSIGHTCPFLMSAPGYLNSTGLSVYPKASTNGVAQACSLKLTSMIGYNGSATTVPCRIWVPLINYSPNYSKLILNQPSTRLLYDDYYVDQILSIQGGSQVSRLYNVQLSRPRTMYIIPYLASTGMANSLQLPPYQQLTSSAPNTCSPCRLSNLQIQIGGQNIFVEPQQYNFHFYNNNILALMGSEYNGNSLKSKFHGGQITKSMWEKAYGVYMFDLCKVASETEDNLMKSFQIQFKLNVPSTLYYDFIVMISYQAELVIDRSTGTVTDPRHA
jgi:hypothetical protein